MKYLKFFIAIVLFSFLFVQCTQNINGLENEIVNIEKIKVRSELSNLPSCLNETVVDSFIYFANEFSDYLLSEDNLKNLVDSGQIAQMIEEQGVSTSEEFYEFVSETWNIPIEVVHNFSEYSVKIANELSRETSRNHPIAYRYYGLINSECLTSVLPNAFFEDNSFVVGIRTDCSFWDVFSSCAMAAGATALAVSAPNPASAVMAATAIGNYIDTLAGC